MTPLLSLRTEVVVSMQVGLAMCYPAGRLLPDLPVSAGGGARLGLALAVGAAHVVLAGLLLRNTILSLAILPAQLTTREQNPVVKAAVRRILAKSYGISVADVVEPWQAAADTQAAFIASAAPSSWVELRLSAEDGVEISAGKWINDDPQCDGSRWLLFACPNGQQWEQLLFILSHQARCLGANLLVFNYRGVGSSGGSARQASDLILDGEAAMDYLLQLAASNGRHDQTPAGHRPRVVLLHGHSLGGAVCLAVCLSRRARAAARGVALAVLNDRSFSALSAVVHSHPLLDPRTGAPAIISACGSLVPSPFITSQDRMFWACQTDSGGMYHIIPAQQ